MYKTSALIVALVLLLIAEISNANPPMETWVDCLSNQADNSVFKRTSNPRCFYVDENTVAAQATPVTDFFVAEAVMITFDSDIEGAGGTTAIRTMLCPIGKADSPYPCDWVNKRIKGTFALGADMEPYYSGSQPVTNTVKYQRLYRGY